MDFFKKSTNTTNSVVAPEYPKFSDSLKSQIDESEDSWKNVIVISDKTKDKNQGLFNRMIMGDDEEPIHQSAFTLREAAELVRTISNIPDQESINIFLHTLGGAAIAMDMVTRALSNHPGTIRVFVPQYAYSAGTYIALVADELYMDQNAVLGPMDIQISGLPLNSIMAALAKHQDKEGYFHTYLDSHLSKVKGDYDDKLNEIINKKFPDQDTEELYNQLSVTHHHGHSLTVPKLKELGLDVKDIKVTWDSVKDPVKCSISLVN